MIVVRLRSPCTKLSRNLGQTKQGVDPTQATHAEADRLQLSSQLQWIVAVELELVIIFRLREALRIRANEQPATRLEHSAHFTERGEVASVERNMLQHVERDHDICGGCGVRKLQR